MAKINANDTDKGNTLPKVEKPNNGKKTAKRGNPKLAEVAGPKFSKENQPNPEAKKLGWQKIREKRMLTASIIDAMFGGDGEPKQAFKDYMRHLMQHAKDGHPQAMKTINNAIEDEVQKIAITDTEGNALPPVIIKSINA